MLPKYCKNNIPVDNWRTYQNKIQKIPVLVRRIEGSFVVINRRGVLICSDGYLALDRSGTPYPIDIADFENKYELIKRDGE